MVNTVEESIRTQMKDVRAEFLMCQFALLVVVPVKDENENMAKAVERWTMDLSVQLQKRFRFGVSPVQSGAENLHPAYRKVMQSAALFEEKETGRSQDICLNTLIRQNLHMSELVYMEHYNSAFACFKEMADTLYQQKSRRLRNQQLSGLMSLTLCMLMETSSENNALLQEAGIDIGALTQPEDDEAELLAEWEKVFGLLEAHQDKRIRGQYSEQFASIYQYMHAHFRGSIVQAAVSGIDIALWDIKGKALGVPVYELLGGATRDKIRAYETTSGKTPEEGAKNVKKLVDEGWNHVRVRPLSNNASDTTAAMCRKNAEMFKAIREVAGWDVDLSCEIHRQCTPIQAIEIGKAIEPYRIHFFEDPFLDIPEVARYVTEKCPVPVANGERCFNLYELSNLVQNTDVAFLRPDMCTIGGITAGMKVAHFAEAHNVNIIPHNPLGPISTIAALHIDRVVPNFEVQEWPGTFGDFNAMIKGDSIKVENGYITMPEGPGLGIELVDDIAEKFPFQGMKPRWSYHEDGSPIDR